MSDAFVYVGPYIRVVPGKFKISEERVVCSSGKSHKVPENALYCPKCGKPTETKKVEVEDQLTVSHVIGEEVDLDVISKEDQDWIATAVSSISGEYVGDDEAEYITFKGTVHFDLDEEAREIDLATLTITPEIVAIVERLKKIMKFEEAELKIGIFGGWC